MELQPPPTCDACGQVVAFEPSAAGFTRLVCPLCRSIQREPQGEAMRLFAPAPNQITGQMSL